MKLFLNEWRVHGTERTVTETLTCVLHNFAFQESALRLPTISELQQPPGLGEKHCCEGTVHGRRRPQPSSTGESQSVIVHVTKLQCSPEREFPVTKNSLRQWNTIWLVNFFNAAYCTSNRVGKKKSCYIWWNTVNLLSLLWFNFLY